MRRRRTGPLGAALLAGGLEVLRPLPHVEAQEVAPAAASDAVLDAGAISPAAADALLQQGIELRKAGDDRAALAAFERAFALDGSIRALAQMALAEQALGLWREAHEHLAEALRHGADRWIAEHRTALEAASREIASQLGSLEISCNVEGAEVQLDGVPLGTTPLASAVALVAGANVILVSKAGYFEIARQVHIDAGRLSRLNIVLTPRPSASAISAAAGGSPAAQTSAPKASQPALSAGPVPGGDAGSSARDALLYATVGLSGLGVSTGVTGFVLREINVAQYNDDARCSRIEGVRRSDECPDQAAAFQRGEILAIGGFAAAAVFGLAASYLWWNRPAAETTESFGCAPGVRSLACSGRF